MTSFRPLLLPLQDSLLVPQQLTGGAAYVGLATLTVPFRFQGHGVSGLTCMVIGDGLVYTVLHFSLLRPLERLVCHLQRNSPAKIVGAGA